MERPAKRSRLNGVMLLSRQRDKSMQIVSNANPGFPLAPKELYTRAEVEYMFRVMEEYYRGKIKGR